MKFLKNSDDGDGQLSLFPAFPANEAVNHSPVTSIPSNTRPALHKMPLKFIDLFAGIGGFHYALHNQGAECVFASEWNDKCRQTYEANFKTITPQLFISGNFAGDITQLDPHHVPDHDILCAGFPCQPFSVSGKQKGFDDERGTLFFNILDIIQAKNTPVVFLENVKHLVHHDNGNTLTTIIQKLEALNYFVSWKILNAKDFGLAQNRERIIIIASQTKKFDFSLVTATTPTPIKIKDILDIQATDTQATDTEGKFDYLAPADYTLLPPALIKPQKSGLIFCGYRNKSLRVAGVRPNTEHLSRVHKQPNRIYHIDGTHPTLASQEASGRFFIYDGKGVRKLTVDECYKLQGFPVTFKKNSNLSACYNQIGNSVAIPMIEAIYQQVVAQFFSEVVIA